MFGLIAAAGTSALATSPTMPAHSLTPATATIASISLGRPNCYKVHAPSPVMVRAQASDRCPSLVVQCNPSIIHRRNIGLGLAGALLVGLSMEEQEALAAARRPPPRPPAEKKDPNVSGIQAKVLANKKRKEAMKEEIAKLRQKGKAVVNDDSPPQ